MMLYGTKDKGGFELVSLGETLVCFYAGKAHEFKRFSAFVAWATMLESVNRNTDKAIPALPLHSSN